MSQSSTRETSTASLAIDGDKSTSSVTVCSYDTDHWYKINFDDVYCISEVIILQLENNYRKQFGMEDTNVLVVNSKTGTESLCGVLKISNKKTWYSQTYTIPCDQKSGDEIVLKVRHNEGEYEKPGCIHMKEIEVKASLSSDCEDSEDSDESDDSDDSDDREDPNFEIQGEI